MYAVFRQPYREDFIQETRLLEALADEEQDVKVAMGYQQNELILRCRYGRRTCQPQ